MSALSGPRAVEASEDRVDHRGVDGIEQRTRNVPVGQVAGWEAAVIDHHRAVLAALAAKVQAGTHVSNSRDEIGGTTLSFDLWPGHPHEAEVRRLLADVRNQIIPLWEKVEEHNKGTPAEPSCKVTFYCGQHLAYGDGDA